MATPSTGARFVGVVVDREALERELASRGLEAKDLAKLANLKPDTLMRARRGERISRDSLMRISDALLRIPMHPVAATLTGHGPAVATRTKEKNAARGRTRHERHMEEVAGASSNRLR